MIAYQIGIDRPADEGGPKGWMEPRSAAAAEKALLKIAGRQRGRGYRIRERGEPFGNKRTFGELKGRIPPRLKALKFGEMLVVWCLRTDVRILVRCVHVQPELIPTVGDDDVDFNHTLIFRERRARYPNAVSWGICVRRFIDGTHIWSTHSPKRPNCRARAEDFHATKSEMEQMATDLADNGRCGKILHAGRAWSPGTGWRPVPGIGHFDHVHAESRDPGGQDVCASCG
jgi:hypothetical protein